MTKKPVIVLFRDDLRFHDNPALFAAAKTGAPLLLLYILDTQSKGKWGLGGASKWWLFHALKEMEERLVFRSGDPAKVLEEVKQECGASQVFTNKTSLLVDPEAVKPYKVFTPYWKCIREMIEPQVLPVPEFETVRVKSEKLEDWNLLGPWTLEGWTPGEKAGRELLDQFKAKDYLELRDFPAVEGTSRLSPYLHFGHISPREAWVKVPSEDFRRQLGWREFSYHLLHYFPDLPQTPFNAKFRKMKWDNDPVKFKAWQKGMTGYPIVDAGMRQLWKTGWMHNRVRMIAASFLIKDLFIDWRKGEEWFWDTLVDADLANNAAGWQWVAGSGADAAPYFRIFNPVLQSEKFDPKGEYIKRWIPELEKMPVESIHKPWEAPLLKGNYPDPIVDHQEARKEALRRLSLCI